MYCRRTRGWTSTCWTGTTPRRSTSPPAAATPTPWVQTSSIIVTLSLCLCFPPFAPRSMSAQCNPLELDKYIPGWVLQWEVRRVDQLWPVTSAAAGSCADDKVQVHELLAAAAPGAISGGKFHQLLWCGPETLHNAPSCSIIDSSTGTAPRECLGRFWHLDVWVIK